MRKFVVMSILVVALFVGSAAGVFAQPESSDVSIVYAESGQTFVMMLTLAELATAEGVQMLEEFYKKGFILEFVQIAPVSLLVPHGAILVIGRSANYK